MVKSFIGIDLKTGGQIILSIYLIENIIIYTIIAIRLNNSKVNDRHNEFILVPVVNTKIEVHAAFQHFLAVFSTFAIVLSAAGLLIKRTKLIVWLYLFHQGIGIEILIILLPIVALKSAYILSLLPILTFAIIKCYCWIVMVSLYKLERTEERKIQFGKQWIINTLMTMEPNIRLTIPNETSRYEQLE
ncbi:hypothetical protein PVAND_008363 [Polypedilum vanderplanki]|uniref:Uncharacterized protein n=1 Tax=Polypedilum vanderplanki TaxID=319348 RepID=A0A9J6CAD0_POLVA|nr:hypothetical protein PVAND_008363 [Polypedilum vanderplanki]